MRFPKAALLCLSLAVPMAASADVVEGRDYAVITPPLITESPGKIEITEFFAYGCPRSFRFEPTLRAWARAQPADVILRPVPTTLRGSDASAKFFYALDAMGDEARLRPAIFSGVHTEQTLNASDERSMGPWLAKKGIDVARFTGAFASFTVNTKVQRATQRVQAARVDGTPTVLVNGRFRILGADAMSPEHFAEVATAVVARVRQDQGRAGPAPVTGTRTPNP